MKNRFFLYLAGCILLLLIGAGRFFLFNGKFMAMNDTAKSGKLFVNGNEITNENAIIRNKYAELPFSEVLIGFGANVKWIDNNTANIMFKNKKYILNLKDKLINKEEEGEDYNLLMTPPGSRNCYEKAIDRELIIDSDTIRVVMYLMGEKIDINIDHDKLIVNITERKN